MPGVTRKGDTCTGHGCWPSRNSTTGSPNVFTNNRPTHRVGDSWAVHCCPKRGCHPGALAKGSPIATANGRAVGRIGDPVNCGSRVATGSNNVFA